MNKETLERFIASWNGEDTTFMFDGDVYTEEDVHEAEDKLKELE